MECGDTKSTSRVTGRQLEVIDNSQGYDGHGKRTLQCFFGHSPS